jgi:hypothetical protein
MSTLDLALAAGASPIAELQAAVARVAAAPVPSDPAVALAEAEALLACEQQLKVLAMRRVADVDARGLHELEGFRSARSWLADRRPDGEVADAWLGQALREFAVLSAAVEAGACSMVAARKVVHVLRQCRRHVDVGDGLIDGCPAAQVMAAVVSNVVTLVCRYLHALDEDDPRLASLVARVRAINEAGGSELTRLEAAFTLLASEVPLPALTGLLEELLLSLVPSLLGQRASIGEAEAGLHLALRPDGRGWRVRGDLDLECGERLFTALRSEATRDPRNPVDTELWVQSRDRGFEPCDTGAEVLRPRDKRRRLHDALDRLLTRYLDAGLGGMCGKVPVQLSVLVPEGILAASEGALPARADSGALIPRALVRSWWCDGSVTAFVVGLGGKALRIIHGQRTLTRRERRALQVQTGGRCAGRDCCPDLPSALSDLVPHHVKRWADHGRTSLDETFLICTWTHYAIHHGRFVLLRDGRYLSESGVSDEPPEPAPPF